MVKKSILYQLLIFMILFSSFAPELSNPIKALASTKFSDVYEDHRAHREITYLVDREIIQGFTDNTFRPKENVTRGQFAAILARALKLPAAESKFTDLQKGQALYEGVSRAAAVGIIQGRLDGRVMPNTEVSRADMAVMIDRALQTKGAHLGLTENLPYEDAKGLPAYAINSIKRMHHYNIVGAYENNKFSSTVFGTREDTAIYVYNMLKVLNQIDDIMDIHFIDVGHGDSTLIITPNGSTILVDTGAQTAGHKVVSYLKKAGVSTIDRLIITNPQVDHIGGAVEVMKNFKIGKVLDSGAVHTTQTYLDYLNYIDKNNIPFEIATPGQIIDLDPKINIKVVNSYQKGDSLNDASVALHITYENFTFLMTGDAELKAEQRIIDNFDVRSFLLKVGHHGSKMSTNDFFFNAVQPRVAIISYGKENSYRLPHPDVISRINNSHIYTTAYSGDIIVSVTSNSNQILAERTPANYFDSVEKSPTEPQYPININTADFETLQYITGVGPVIAQRILDYRKLHGPFKKIEDLKKVNGIGDATFERLKDEITVGE